MVKKRYGEMCEKLRPHFFKLMIHSLTRNRMRIPPYFLKHILGDLSENATLTGPLNRSWNVKLRQDENSMFFVEGWKEFLRDNSLGDNEFLVFRYDGDMHFHVEIYEENGLSRMDLSSTMIPEVGASSTRSHKQDKKCVCQKMRREEKDEGPSKVPVVVDERTRTGSSFINCSFATQLTASSVNRSAVQRLPKRISDLFLPPCDIRVAFRNSKGMTRKVKAKYYDGFHILSAGWKSFVRQNRLEKGDYCTFELVDKHALCFQVHVSHQAATV
ncbi:B3 DNA binding domain [Dillenia turbinata]|uniref:B3 DNA binding domain n=1 Tax=Dillenia turbinata TaxID=194707 RepID=A0AAN8YY38_9MAGN